MNRRIDHRDWAAMTGMIDNVNRMAQRNELYRQHQEEYQEQRAFKNDVNTNFEALSQAPAPEAPQYEANGAYVAPQGQAQETALVGTPQAKIAAQELVARDKQSKDVIKYDQSLNALAEWRQKNPGVAWDKAPLDIYAGAAGQKAYADVIARDAQSEQNMTAIMQNRMLRADVGFKTFEASRQHIDSAMQNGKIDEAVNGLQQLSKELPLPYQLGEYDPGTQSFDVQYLDSNTGKFQNSGKMTLQEAMTQMNAMGKKEFAQQVALHAEAVRQGNIEKRQNPMYGKGMGGRRYLIIPQKNVHDPNQVDIEVRDEKTNEKIMFSSWEALQNAGINVENLGRESDLLTLDLKKQQIATSRAAMGANQGMADGESVKALKQQLDFYSKKFNMALAPFKEGSGGLGFTINAQGQPEFEDGGAAYNKSQEFYHQHADDWQTLSKKDQEKFEGAVMAREAYRAAMSLGTNAQQAMGGGEPVDRTQAIVDKLRAFEAAGDEEGAGRAVAALKQQDPNLYQQVMGVLTAGSDGMVQPTGRDNAPAAPAEQEAPGAEAEPEQRPTALDQAMGDEGQPQIRPELPQDMSQWNFQIISQGGRQIPVVMTERGPIPLTPEEVEMYQEFSGRQKRQAIGSGIRSGAEWFKNNATGTHQIPSGRM